MSGRRRYELGDPIDIHCRYCKLNLNGVVAAIVNNRPVKVQCRTCRMFQDYAPPVNEALVRQKLMRKVLRLRDRHAPAAPRSRAAPATEQSLDQSAVARRLWDEATKDVNPLKSRVYNPTLTFHKEDLISHPVLGLGIVSAANNDQILVLFRDGFKRLDHNRPPIEDE